MLQPMTFSICLDTAVQSKVLEQLSLSRRTGYLHGYIGSAARQCSQVVQRPELYFEIIIICNYFYCESEWSD